MSASQSGVFNLQEFTDLGAPLVGGRLYTYVQGTTTQKTAYTDHAGTIPHTYTSDGLGGQYIALNTRGELPAPLYLAAGSYDLALKSAAGATVWTRRADPVWDITSDLSTSAGASLVGFIQSGTGAVQRTMQDKAREAVSIFDYGAVGNGIADDTSAFDKCMAACGYVFIPPGFNVTYSKQLTLASGQCIFGNLSVGGVGSAYTSTLTFTNAAANQSGIITALNGGYNRVHDLVVIGPGVASATVGLYPIKNSFSQYERVFIRNFQTGLADVQVQDNRYADIVINTCTTGVLWASGSANDWHTMCTYERIYVSGCSSTGFYLNQTVSPFSQCNAFRECAADGAPIGWSVNNINDTTFENCYTELFTTYGFYFNGCVNLGVKSLFIGAGANAGTSAATVPLYVFQCNGSKFDNIALRGDANGVDAGYTTHISFLGGSTYFNEINNYYRQDGLSSTLNFSSNNTLTSQQKQNSYKQIAVEGWTAMGALSNVWAAYGGAWPAPSYFKDSNGIVHVKGMIKSGTTTPGTAIFTFPAGYRPIDLQSIVVDVNGAYGTVNISSAGVLTTGTIGTNVAVALYFSFPTN